MKNGITIGMDLGDKFHIAVAFDSEGNELGSTEVRNTKSGIKKYFREYEGATVAMEAGTHSPWISRFLSEELNCRVHVGNPRKLRFIWDSNDKSDERDARMLGLVCRLEPRLLSVLHHRSRQAQADLCVIKSRNKLVQVRTQLVNHARGLVKSIGERLPKCSSASFSRRCADCIPEELEPALRPILESITALNGKIKELDESILLMSRDQYPETALLLQVSGVGPVTALTFILTFEDPSRFNRSRQVGPFLGLVPKRDQSGTNDKQLHITKAGNTYLRQLLVNCAHHILGRYGQDSLLRRHGQAIAARGGKNAKKRAAVAVARKLAVLLHHLWVSGEEYEPFYNALAQKAA